MVNVLSIDRAEWQRDSGGVWIRLHATNPQQAMTACDMVEQGKTYDVAIKEHRGKRSLDANAYAWTLLDKLAEHYGISKETAYRTQIRNIGGNSTIVCVKNEAVDKLVEGWHGNGIGWVTDTMPSKIAGCTNVMLYYGSSTYDTAQMSRLIDNIVQDCKDAGIETMTPAELARMMEGWHG